MSSELIGRVVVDSTEVAEEMVGRLSALLARPEELAEDCVPTSRRGDAAIEPGLVGCKFCDGKVTPSVTVT